MTELFPCTVTPKCLSWVKRTSTRCGRGQWGSSGSQYTMWQFPEYLLEPCEEENIFGDSEETANTVREDDERQDERWLTRRSRTNQAPISSIDLSASPKICVRSHSDRSISSVPNEGVLIAFNTTLPMKYSLGPKFPTSRALLVCKVSRKNWRSNLFCFSLS